MRALAQWLLNASRHLVAATGGSSPCCGGNVGAVSAENADGRNVGCGAADLLGRLRSGTVCSAELRLVVLLWAWSELALWRVAVVPAPF